MRSIVLTLCLGLTVTTAVSQTTKKPTSVNRPSSTAPSKKTPAAKKNDKGSAAAKPKPIDKNASASKTRTRAATPASSAKARQPAKPAEIAPDDKAEFEKASNLSGTNEKIEALKKFIAAFPASTLRPQAAELLSATAYTAGEERLAANDDSQAITLYKLAIDSAPKPIPDKLFNESLSKIATTLYWRGSRADALGLAKALETKVAENADQLAAMAMFHASIEDGEGAVRAAQMATRADPTSAKAFQALGFANRVNFQLDDSASAYAKAVELDPSSTANKRNLAEIKRALGKADEAAAIFRDIVTSDPADVPARNGLVLSLFDAGKQDEAEAELSKALEQDPRNVMLMGGAAYWYAANKNADKAVDLAQKAIAVEPRYVWSYIALGRGLMLQNKPLEAEETLLRAKQYGNFPTLEYEIASARCMAGFYREAVEELQKDFTLIDDSLTTRIGRRVERKDTTFAGVLADERRASILEPSAADDIEIATKLKSLLAFDKAIAGDKPDEAAAIKAADAFVGGDDKYKLHRELYAASVLLDKKIAAQKAFEYASAAVGGTDAALDVPNAGAAVMASGLYDSRQIAFARNELVQVPEVPRPMLSAILRGHVEELVGSALLQQDKASEADIHFRRALSIYPDQSAWWRSAMWRLGSALQAEGKDQEALDAYIKSYSIDKPSLAHYTVVEALYKKVNGTTDGLEAKVGRSPIADIPTQEVATNVAPSEQPNPALPAATPGPTPTPAADAVVLPSPSPSVSSTADATATPSGSSAAAAPSSSIGPTVSATPASAAVATPTPVATSESTPTPATSPEPTATPSPEPAPTPTPNVVAEATPAPSPTPTPDETPKPEPTETPAALKPEPSPEPASTHIEPKPTPEPTAEPTPTVTPEPVPAATPVASPSPVETKQEGSSSPAKTDAIPESEPSPEPSPAGTPLVASTPSDTSVAKVVISPEPTPTSLNALIGERARIANNPSSSPPETKPKAIFEPIVITVPKHDTSTMAEARVRIVDGQPITSVDVPPCTIRVSQEKVSLLNDGGSASVLVGVDEMGDLAAIRAVSSSPDDVAAELDADVDAIQGRRLFVIRSLTEKTGMFQVVFKLPCGVKEISVTVR